MGRSLTNKSVYLYEIVSPRTLTQFYPGFDAFSHYAGSQMSFGKLVKKSCCTYEADVLIEHEAVGEVLPPLFDLVSIPVVS